MKKIMVIVLFFTILNSSIAFSMENNGVNQNFDMRQFNFNNIFSIIKYGANFIVVESGRILLRIVIESYIKKEDNQKNTQCNCCDLNTLLNNRKIYKYKNESIALNNDEI